MNMDEVTFKIQELRLIPEKGSTKDWTVLLRASGIMEGIQRQDGDDDFPDEDSVILMSDD